MLIDYHIHTPWCNHAEGSPEEYVQRAIELGICEIGFSEHSPWMKQDTKKLAPTLEELEEYFNEITRLKAKYNETGTITVRLGMEMDYTRDTISLAEHYASHPAIDYVIGSVHTIGTWGFEHIEQGEIFHLRGIEPAYKDYFSLLIEMINTRIFDVVGHIDLIKMYGHRPENGYRDLMEKTTETLAKTNMVVELNTSGFDRPVGEAYPGEDFLHVLHTYAVPLTLGSDAHQLAQLGRHFDRAIQMLRSAGYTHLTGFDKRSRISIPL